MSTKVLEPGTYPDTATVPPRERIIAVARELFYRQGIHGVGVDAIAEAAATNKMTLYRHFESKDALVAECLRRRAEELDDAFEQISVEHPGDPAGTLVAWLRFLGEFKVSDRGCAFANAAVELPDPNHPARRVIEEHKRHYRERLVTLARAAGLVNPELLADEIFLLCEGARVSLQSVGPNGPAAKLPEMLQALIAGHRRAQ